MLVPSYTLSLHKPKCNVFAEANHATALLAEDVREVLPYLNAEVRGCRYAPQAPALTLSYDDRSVVIWPREIAVGACEDEADARRVVDGVCALMNEVWARRDSLVPNHEGFQQLTAMQAYRQLPGTNCRECGEAACLAFAVKLVSGQASLGACAPLGRAEYEDNRRNLVADLLACGGDVPDDWR